MRDRLIDTNVIVRFLVENPSRVQPKFKGVFTFFQKIERGEINVILPELVVFEAFYVLTSFYKVPASDAAEKLAILVSFEGIRMPPKSLILSCLALVRRKRLSLVDAYLLAFCRENGIRQVYSYDKDLSKQGLQLITVG